MAWENDVDLLTFPYGRRTLPGDATDDAQQDEDRLLPPDVRRKRLVAGAGGLDLVAQLPAGVSRAPSTFGVQDWSRAHLDEPPGAYLFNLPQVIAPVIIAAGVSAVVVAWPMVPQGQRGVVRRIGFVTNFPDQTRITTRVNQSPVPPFPGTIGAIGTLEDPFTTVVLLAPGDSFDMWVTNLGPGNITVRVRTYGWLWAPPVA